MMFCNYLQVMHKMFPDLFEAQPDLLFQLVTMLNPKVLHDNNVPVCTTIQVCCHSSWYKHVMIMDSYENIIILYLKLS